MCSDLFCMFRREFRAFIYFELSEAFDCLSCLPPAAGQTQTVGQPPRQATGQTQASGQTQAAGHLPTYAPGQTQAAGDLPTPATGQRQADGGQPHARSSYPWCGC